MVETLMDAGAEIADHMDWSRHFHRMPLHFVKQTNNDEII